MSDLREKLARRFADAFIPADWPRFSDGSIDMASARVIVNSQPPVAVTFGDLADECLRQMRYAAHEWPEDAYPSSGESIAPADYDPFVRFPDQRP